ncbi:hypothetical protein LTR37_016989 [Vermiconidia calcicola]|uniref:Uncharacterized protein n=1 Tax=Vermiconidia calcicola TaxID=1690605 RepID=A0ACC3MP56_9PEZI|nr:hypothetical protein LTR37_016989 [Vermiconidia calcicola]
MPVIFEDEGAGASNGATELPFPLMTTEHILHCSYHYWHPKYRATTPKARLIPLSKPFLDYLRADGIILPSDEDERATWSDTDSGIFSASDNPDAYDQSDEEDEDVAAGWRNVHNAIKNTIAELGGKVVPKLNWSAPKDATWMNANTMECRTPNEIYLLLKSSDFITHDLEHAFDDTVASPSSSLTQESIPFHLVLRKAVGQWNPSVEFRCFVRGRRLLCMCQRDLNHFDFLFNMSGRLRSLIQEFFDVRLRDSFPDENFVFDVYVPPPHNRVWLVDVNPWAPRTDPLLFSWMEILNMPEPREPEAEDETPDFVRLSLADTSNRDTGRLLQQMRDASDAYDEEHGDDEDDDSDVDEAIWLPELRLVRKDDPEAYSFNAPKYSAHKLPRDVVDAAQSGEGLREFARDWQNILDKRQKEEQELGESSEGD